MFASLEKACSDLNHGNPIGIPTETVYGLAANAYNDEAVQKIYALKNRPAVNPLIIHVGSLQQAQDFAYVSTEAVKIAEQFWPGPLTMVLPQLPNNRLSKYATANLKTVAVRLPSHPLAQSILQQLSFPLAAPSANISETVSPTSALHVKEAFPHISIVDGGACKAGLESTILDLSTDTPTILRPGTITKSSLESVLLKTIDEFNTDTEKNNSLKAESHIHESFEKKLEQQKAFKAPGLMKRHYAPKTPVRLNANHCENDEFLLAFGPTTLTSKRMLNLSPAGDLAEAATNLFAFLRKADEFTGEISRIAIMPIPNTGIGVAINNRLNRAAASDTG